MWHPCNLTVNPHPYIQELTEQSVMMNTEIIKLRMGIWQTGVTWREIQRRSFKSSGNGGMRLLEDCIAFINKK
jgi:hypothetical protein